MNRKRYPTDLTDDQWAIIGPLIPVNANGRPRSVDTREILNAIFYLRGYPGNLSLHGKGLRIINER